MVKQVVTLFGGSGFIGRHLVHKLAKRGFEVRIAVRNTEFAHVLKPAGDVGQIVPWQTDICDPAQVATAIEGAYAAVNLVGILYERGERSFQRMHVEAAENIAIAALNGGVQRLVHVSAIGADIESSSAYGYTKAAGEIAVKAAFPSATIMRPSVIFGPEDNFFNMFAGIMRLSPVLPVMGSRPWPKISIGGLTLIDFDFFGKGGCSFQPVFVGDVAEAIMYALTEVTNEGEIYELGGPRVYSFKEIMELLLQTTGRERVLIPMPLWLAHAQAMILQLFPKPLLTIDQVRMMETDNVVSGDCPGLAELKIKAKTAEAILPTYLQRFRTPRSKGFDIQ
ncbi:MAG: complex I NDUFA9 subunit family protein [Rhodospirillaceae bacterium TMED8]|nr:complex I NDUFA9 subunit family protein [Magnetovibrio sp.]OUT53349.1 MAG: complex I NDUFA9 subunit family protein [Rhodospirillaceae bacterium TMED8]